MKDAEGDDLSQLYGREYYHGAIYDDYTLKKLGRDFVQKAKFVRKLCGNGSRLLDVGCAFGYFMKCAAEEGFDVYGVDFSKYAVERGRQLLGDRVVCADVEKEIPFQKSSFDVVTVWDTLEHLRDPQAFLKKARYVLKKEGLIFITTLNYDSLWSRLMKERWFFIVPLYHPSHTITVQRLRTWLKTAGLEVVSLHTFGFTLRGALKKTKLADTVRLLRIGESVSRFEMQIILRLLEPLNLGDTIECVAKRAY